MAQEGSPKFSLSKEDIKSILRGAAIAAVAAILTYIAEQVIPQLQSQPGANAALFTLFASAINALRKFVSDTQKTVIVSALIGLLSLSGGSEVIQ